MNLAIVDATIGVTGTSPMSRYATPIANLPLIGHVFDELAASGIEDAHVVARPDVRRDLARILGAGRSWGVAVSYVETPDSDGRETVLAELGRALSEGPVLLHPGDCLFRSQVSSMRERFCAGDVDSVLPQQASIEPSADLTEARVSDTVLVLGPATWSLLQDLAAAPSRTVRLVSMLLHSNFRLAVCEETEHWLYSDTTDALLAANRMMLDSLPVPAAETTLSDGNQVHGRVAITPGATVSNCVLHGPLAIDARAVVEDSFIGPYTAIGPGAVVSGTEIDNSMVLSGAEIRHPGFRIESSIIGERSHVVRGFELPRGVHMRLGADSRVTFS